jgi:hypothetical protein
MRQDIPYVYSNDAKLRISIINKFWKPREEFVRNLLKKRGYPKKNNFSGFKLIGYHSFVELEDREEKLKQQATLIDVKFTFNTDYQPRKLGRPHILLQNASSHDFEAEVFAHVEKGQDIFLLAYTPTCAAPIIELIISDYLLSVMLDDINLGKHIQLLDICLKSEDQPFPGHFVSARSHKNFEATIPHELSFKEGWDGTGIFVGKVFNHSSVTLEEFHQMAGYDYVLEQAKKLYYDPNHKEHMSQQWTFDEFLQRQHDNYSKPLGL